MNKETFFSPKHPARDIEPNQVNCLYNKGKKEGTKMNREQCLDEAKKCVCRDRESQYGSPENNFKRISFLWSDYLGEDITPQDVANMMILLKIARAKAGNFKNDNYIDIAGYSACACELGESE